MKYSMSSFSSWGVSPDLRLKPEVTAPGGNIYSSLPEDSYGFMSGTSMATPQLTGASAIVLQRVQSDPLFASMDARHKSDVVQNLLMGTATPVVDPLQDTGAYYSPRKQGAGLVNVLAATTSSVYPSVVGAADPSRPKATSRRHDGLALRRYPPQPLRRGGDLRDELAGALRDR